MWPAALSVWPDDHSRVPPGAVGRAPGASRAHSSLIHSPLSTSSPHSNSKWAKRGNSEMGHLINCPSTFTHASKYQLALMN